MSYVEGETLATPLGRSGVFPPMVCRMIAIGEKSGALEALLEKISEFYDQQVNWSPPFEDGLERATVVVPRDYANPDGPKLTIALARLRATDPGRRRGKR